VIYPEFLRQLGKRGKERGGGLEEEAIYVPPLLIFSLKRGRGKGRNSRPPPSQIEEGEAKGEGKNKELLAGGRT